MLYDDDRIRRYLWQDVQFGMHSEDVFEIRDVYEATVANQAAEIERLKATLALAWQPVVDGTELTDPRYPGVLHVSPPLLVIHNNLDGEALSFKHSDDYAFCRKVKQEEREQ